MAKTLSAGLLLFRRRGASIEVLLGHMGGPFWAGKDAGAWSIPKGECDPEEDPFSVALREFREEIGLDLPAMEFVDLGPVEQSRAKVVHVWAAEGDLDLRDSVSNTFALEWPKGSGTIRDFPEIDRVAWLDIDTARTKVVRGQVAVLDRLVDRV